VAAFIYTRIPGEYLTNVSYSGIELTLGNDTSGS